MLVCMLLVVARSTVAARTNVEDERRLGCLAPGVFVLRCGRAACRRRLFCHTIIISFLLCIFVCARPSPSTEIETPRHDNVKQLVWSPPS